MRRRQVQPSMMRLSCGLFMMAAVVLAVIITVIRLLAFVGYVGLPVSVLVWIYMTNAQVDKKYRDYASVALIITAVITLLNVGLLMMPSSERSESPVTQVAETTTRTTTTQPTTESNTTLPTTTESTSATTTTSSEATTSVPVISGGDRTPLAFSGSRQLVLEDLDSLRRARGAHIQLQDKDEPTAKREPSLSYNPVGWHNYKFTIPDSGKSAWLMNRGHLVGYQFSGLNDDARNLVPMTAWLNTGNYSGTDDANPDGMLYYENRLDNWLALHPNYWLDYKVTPLYQGLELIPRQIELQYVGLDDSGASIAITLGGRREQRLVNDITIVTLDNRSPNATLNYSTGTATNTPDTTE